MEIRSVTLFCDPTTDPQKTAAFLADARNLFPVPVQTTRLALPPFPDWWPTQVNDRYGLKVEAETLETIWRAAGVDYLSLGPVKLRHNPDWLDVIPTLLSGSEVLFTAAEVADTYGRIGVKRTQQVARLIRRISTILDNGFGNLYFTALANCPSGSPFFPVAYHEGGKAHFAVAVEAADLALQAIQGSRTLEEARHDLVAAIEVAAEQITTTAEELAQTHRLPFSGIDFSLAPFPTNDRSLGGALEALGVPFVGATGGLFAAGFITEAIERAQFRRCGFSGLMLPVLEDSVLAARAAEGVLSVLDLLTNSAVCGVGLDTIPLPGDVSEAALTAVLLDVAMLATRLNKPLTARLMPLPGLAAGDPVTFDFPYFADSCVMSLPGDGVSGVMGQPSRLTFHPIRSVARES